MSKIVIDIVDRFRKPKSMTDLVIFTDVRNYMPDWDTERYLIACVKYAQENNVFVIPTRFATHKKIFMCLISPEGKIENIQSAVHLNLVYKGIFAPSNDINIIDVMGIKIALAVDVDIYHPEYFMQAKKLGCDIIVSSQYIDVAEYDDTMLIFGAWNAAQTAGLYVINCNNNSTVVCAPCDLTEDKSGFILHPFEDKQLQFKIFTHKLEKYWDLKFTCNSLEDDLLREHISQLVVG